MPPTKPTRMVDRTAAVSMLNMRLILQEELACVRHQNGSRKLSRAAHSQSQSVAPIIARVRAAPPCHPRRAPEESSAQSLRQRSAAP